MFGIVRGFLNRRFDATMKRYEEEDAAALAALGDIKNSKNKLITALESEGYTEGLQRDLNELIRRAHDCAKGVGVHERATVQEWSELLALCAEYDQVAAAEHIILAVKQGSYDLRKVAEEKWTNILWQMPMDKVKELSIYDIKLYTQNLQVFNFDNQNLLFLKEILQKRLHQERPAGTQAVHSPIVVR